MMVYDSQKDSMATINQRYLMHGARDGQRPTSGFAFYKAWQMSCGPSEILLPWYEGMQTHQGLMTDCSCATTCAQRPWKNRAERARTV
ncbi:hypothetical protein HBI56_038960 [Parastagonospora nodorum]|nr:hypothetical protein HBH53_014130 [Parastagonospora nodorum]KAH3987950.1 hypothetical protein HBH51_003750 [Parastagonospora nodorum]KAH4004792.1 hypothetical protein HBI10_042250 [Parastagonospora nodorum]KAH4030852.1 hypothetical protein HBI13_025700 [Parastagonospora nodorum]KAH4040413.1 hypothetical protein HBI09_027660 [Parastagonospora nodorum]